MKHLPTLLTIALLTLPSPLYAQQTTSKPPSLEFVEKPVTTLCGDPPRKCLDQANFKLYLRMRVQYVWLLEQHTEVWPAIEAELKKSSGAAVAVALTNGARAARAERAYDEIFPKYENAVKRATKAEAMSLWGGGLPWLITVAVAGLAAGTVLGIYLESKVAP